MDSGPRSLQAVRSVGRWLWPTLAVSGFLAVVAYTVGHDDPAPGLSQRGLLTIALAAAVVILLTIHRRYGPGLLTRALAEYTLVAVLAGLLAATGAGTSQPAADHPSPAKAEASGDDRPAVIQLGAKVVRAVTGAVGWLADLWRQADRTTEPANPNARSGSPRSPAPRVLLLWRCL
jgi:hypothetical protein